MPSAQLLGKLASPLLYYSGVYSRGWRRRTCRDSITIVLVYHRVTGVDQAVSGGFDIETGISAAVFEAQMRFMLKHFVPITASEVLDAPVRGIRFAVTFDDGYEDNYRVAAPILRRLGIPATFYVVSDYVGTERLFWWEQFAEMIRNSRVPDLDLGSVLPDWVDSMGLPGHFPLIDAGERKCAYEHLSTAMRSGLHVDLPRVLSVLAELLEVQPIREGRAYGLMNWAQLKELHAQGFEIGGHTAAHCNLVGAEHGMLRSELLDSINAIEFELDTPVLTFAYPYGNFERSPNPVAEILAHTHCRAAFTCVRQAVTKEVDPFAIPRSRLNRRFNFACAFNIQQSINDTFR